MKLSSVLGMALFWGAVMVGCKTTSNQNQGSNFSEQKGKANITLTGCYSIEGRGRDNSI